MTSKPRIPPHRDSLQASNLPLMDAVTSWVYNSRLPLGKTCAMIIRNFYCSNLKYLPTFSLITFRNLISNKETGMISKDRLIGSSAAHGLDKNASPPWHCSGPQLMPKRNAQALTPSAHIFYLSQIAAYFLVFKTWSHSINSKYTVFMIHQGGTSGLNSIESRSRNERRSIFWRRAD